MCRRTWWENCIIQPDDAEVNLIDQMEDHIAPLFPDTRRIRGLITGLELCHHKAERWVAVIIEAIGKGRTTKGPGTRPPGSIHPAETAWRNAMAVLSALCEGRAIPDDFPIRSLSARDLVRKLGDPTPLRIWQLQRVIAKIKTFTEPSTCYLELTGEVNCFTDAKDYCRQTVETIIHDTVDGKPACISLAAAIDHLEPCHWAFVENLSIVIGAIGGDLVPGRPFAACARNMKLTPIRPRMCVISDTLRVFVGCHSSASAVDESILAVLGDRTPQKLWLTASLEKTIRAQLGYPPTDPYSGCAQS